MLLGELFLSGTGMSCKEWCSRGGFTTSLQEYSLHSQLFSCPIQVVKVPQKTLLMDALKEESEIVYDFCMCNPPFFANQMEAQVNSS